MTNSEPAEPVKSEAQERGEWLDDPSITPEERAKRLRDDYVNSKWASGFTYIQKPPA